MFAVRGAHVYPTPHQDCSVQEQRRRAAPGSSSDLLSGSSFEIDAAVPPPAGSKSATLPTKGANLALNHSGCRDWLKTAPGAGTGVAADRTSGTNFTLDKASGSGDDSFGQ